MNATLPPLARALRRPSHAAPHYLWLGIAVSLGVLAVAMGWPPAAAPARETAARPLKVSLVNARSEDAPPAPDVAAQQNVDGGGTERPGTLATPLPHTGPSPNTIVLEALRKRQAELEVEQLRLLTRLTGERHVSAERPNAHPWQDAPTPGNADASQTSAVLNAQIAALAERIERDSQAPRRAFVAPAAMQVPYAAYVDGWRTRIETIGTRHFPAEARGAGASLRMSVTLAADGSVVAADIDQPARNPALNLAARRIVQLSAPFPHFPPELAAVTDRLTITRTLHFVHDTLDTRAP